MLSFSVLLYRIELYDDVDCRDDDHYGDDEMFYVRGKSVADHSCAVEKVDGRNHIDHSEY